MSRAGQGEDQDLQRWLGEAPGQSGHDPLLEALDSAFKAASEMERAEKALAKVRKAIASAWPNAVYYGTFRGTPVGDLHIAVSDRGVLALGFGRPLDDFLNHLERWTGLRPQLDRARVAPAAQQIMEYLEGRRRSFDLPLDLRMLTPFQRSVLERITALAAGEVATYAQVAAWLGKPRAARAVGQALARNPIPLVIPCHRVLASDGSLGGYSGGEGPPTKLRLLQMEGAPLSLRGGASR